MKLSKLDIFIADDDEDDIFLIRELIREGLQEYELNMVSCVDCSEVLAKIEENSFDICLMDYRLGEGDGIGLLHEMRDKGIEVPVILLTGQGDQETAVKAMKAGANDYLVKSNLSVEVLCQSIRHTIKLHEEELQRKKAEKIVLAQGFLLHGVSEATHKLLTVQDHASSIDEALAILGRATLANAGFIFKHIDAKQEASLCQLQYSWNLNSASNYQIIEGREFSYSSLGLVDCYPALLEGNPLVVTENTSSSATNDLFKSEEVKVILLFPIFTESIFWGFLGFGSEERQWNENEKSILQATAASIGGQIKRHIDKESFQQIVEGTSSRFGDDFFKSLVHHLALAFPVSNAYVTEVIDHNELQVRVISGWQDDKFFSNFEYNVLATPCEDILAGMMTYHPDKVQDLFPKDSYLAELNARSYAGVPCFDSSFKVIGHLAVIDDKPMVDKERTLSILKLFAARAGAEIERKRAEEIIKNMAYNDALTGLPNRTLLADRLSMGLAHAQRSKGKLVLLYLDFDHFKEINDTLGHDIGDEVLKTLANRLRGCLRKEDTVARLGGDEFIVLLPEVDSTDTAGVMAQKILDVCSPPMNIEKHELRITLSIGIAVYPEHGSDEASLMKKSDEALYFAKDNGRNCYQFYSLNKVKEAN